tara:strand:+ start:661 stop:1314 length:654 start_codon:yes stop_codon:yes gene_type:complete
MNPRIEQKIPFNIVDYPSILKWIKDNKGKILFPKRIITSRYFDNFKLEMFHETQEGIIPRKKIRIRNYGSRKLNELKNDFSFEYKLSTDNMRLKNEKKIINNNEFLKFSSFGIEDKKYGTCFPILDISYEREYFLVKDIRLTIDTSIEYDGKSNFLKENLNQIFLKDKVCVCEIKCEFNYESNKLLNDFPFQRIQFSKYERGIELLEISEKFAFINK